MSIPDCDPESFALDYPDPEAGVAVLARLGMALSCCGWQNEGKVKVGSRVRMCGGTFGNRSFDDSLITFLKPGIHIPYQWFDWEADVLEVLDGGSLKVRPLVCREGIELRSVSNLDWGMTHISSVAEVLS